MTNKSSFSLCDQSSSSLVPAARFSASTHEKKRNASVHSANPKAKKQKLLNCDDKDKEDNDLMSSTSADLAIHTQLEQHLIGEF